MDVLLLYNRPRLPADHPDASQEAGVLESVEAASAALAAGGHRVRHLALDEPAVELLARLAALAPPDVVFNLCEGFGGVGRGEAEVAGIIELLGWPLTGSPAKCLALVRDKPRAKWLLTGAGLPTPEFVLLGAREERVASEHRHGRAIAKLLSRGPLIVKPAHEDASLGIGVESVVSDNDALWRQVDVVRGRYGAVLVEQYIAGREFNAAVLALPQPQSLPLAEIDFDASMAPTARIVSYAAKWDAGSASDLATAPRCPADVPSELAARINAIAQDAFALAGCRQYARVDLRMNDAGEVFVLEINGNPDIGPSAGLARAVRASGMSYEDFIARLVSAAAHGA